MEKKEFDLLINQLKSIEGKLDLLVKLTKTTIPSPKFTTEERKILKMCNQKNSLVDIIRETEKSRNSIETILSHLRGKGIIESTKVKGKLVYRRIR